MNNTWQGRIRSRWLAVTAAALVAGVGLPASADMVVIRASGPGLKTGAVVASGAGVTLPAGSSATLLAQDGRSVKISGPYQGVPDQGSGGDAKVVTALSRLLTTGGGDSHSLGVTRGTDVFESHAVNPGGGVYCARANRAAVFQRGMSITATRLVITSANGAVTEVKWPESATEVPWPQEQPLRDGATYLIEQEGKPKPGKLMVRRVPGDVEGEAAVAAWMAENGCSRQAMAVLKSIK
jgi:hypothetical protein